MKPKTPFIIVNFKTYKKGTGKKALELNLSYILLSKGGPLKKVENLLSALKHLNSIETLK